MRDFRSEPEYLAERRKVIRDNHPDRGGSDAQLIKALADLDEQWSRRLTLRRQVREHRPPFISEDTAVQAADAAGAYVDRISAAAQNLRERTARMDLTPSSLPERLAKRAGRLAGTIRHTVTERLPHEFRQGYRQDPPSSQKD
ncbi:MAG TPA: hypothetical protein H9867_08355 [Candidatus Corynebacterium gallistercoris]|uniref:Uncharacterized protein n=1 Tax=Candidatus Corynebacterium gallistercoris TaxID=2838530 RepID=A0A9D1RXS1_9CORY|nr:hypothetical protein [Candidatus Corynebacterium gallistercoris]